MSSEWSFALKYIILFRLWQWFAGKRGILGQSVFSRGGNKFWKAPIYLFCISCLPSEIQGSDFLSENIYLLEYIWPKSCRLMEHTHLLCPYKKFQPHSIHMCGENELLVRRLLNWTPGRTVHCTMDEGGVWHIWGPSMTSEEPQNLAQFW